MLCSRQGCCSQSICYKEVFYEIRIKSAKREGWKYWKDNKLMTEETDEVLRLASAFNVGDIVEKRGNKLCKR